MRNTVPPSFPLRLRPVQDDWVDAVWETSREAFSLGGLLVLRQELEMLAHMFGASGISLSIDDDRLSAELPRQVFRSAFPSRVRFGRRSDHSWPVISESSTSPFSYKSFQRVIELWQETRRSPLLQGSEEDMRAAERYRGKMAGEIYTLHLKQILGGALQESNADMAEWGKFLGEYASTGVREFVLLGRDKIPDSITQIPGVHRAEDSRMLLSVQMCLISQSDGFLGMASGICQGAIFSRVPYVIFKHPDHHPEEMERELGAADSFPFALPHQELWRKEARFQNLERALHHLENANR